MRSRNLLALAILMSTATARAHADPEIVQPILSKQLQSPAVVTYQLQKVLEGKVPPLVVPANADQWTAETQRIRRHLLDDVIFHGWLQEWLRSVPHFEDLGYLPSGKGYKLRYAIVPGFYSTALLYEPENMLGKVPAVLNVMEHFIPAGNKEEFQQALCINHALNGMIALNLEWIGMGELNTRFNDHWFASQLDLVGMNGVGLFYLAMRAPRPTLLIYNAEDDCCYRAPLVRPYVFDPVIPFHKLYGKDDAFQYYQSTLISAHNYGLEDRTQAYSIFIRQFHLTADSAAIPVGQYVKTFDELRGGIPLDNLTILGLARKMSGQLSRPPIPVDSAGLKVWSDAQKEKLRDVQTSDRAPLTIVINDKGKKGAATEVWDQAPEVANRIERGEQLLALDLMGMGVASPDQPAELFAEMLAATGERPLGMEAAQLIGVSRWAQDAWAPSQIRLEGTGICSQVISLTVSALEPRLFSQVELYGGMHSLSYLLEEPVEYKDAPDLFCLDLYTKFELDRMKALAGPTEVIQQDFVEVSAPGK